MENKKSVMYYGDGGFYDPEIHTEIPENAVEISREYWQELLDAQANGKVIQPDKNGYPVAVTPEKPKATHKELIDFVSAEADKIAYGGITIIANEQKYLFKTTTDNITRCNAVLARFEALPDDTVIPWEVWQGDFPTMLPVNEAQFRQCFAFGSQMIINVELAKGTLNANIQALTDEQLADADYVMAFKENAVIQLAAVNTELKLDAEQPAETPEQTE